MGLRYIYHESERNDEVLPPGVSASHCLSGRARLACDLSYDCAPMSPNIKHSLKAVGRNLVFVSTSDRLWASVIVPQQSGYRFGSGSVMSNAQEQTQLQKVQ